MIALYLNHCVEGDALMVALEIFCTQKILNFAKRISLAEYKEFRADMKERLYQATPYCTLPQFVLGK
jgi:hypothetical protein